MIEADDGQKALDVFAATTPDLIILDIAMPEMDGLAVCREIRRHSDVPILFLSSRTDEVDRVVGLEIGGDDYVTKPFSPRELVARVKAVLRRAEAPPEPSAGAARLLRHGRLTVDLDRFRATWDEREVVLTVTEFGLLRTLLAFPGKVYTRDELMERAYAEETVVSGRTIDSHVRRLRAKFAAMGAEPVETVHGLGYRVGACD